MWCFGKSSFDFTRPYFFVQKLNWVILDLLERLGGVLSICIMIESMGGYGTIQKFIFLTLIILCFLQNVPRAIK